MGNLRQKYTDEEWEELVAEVEAKKQQRVKIEVDKLIGISDETKSHLRSFTKSVLHGDREHRDWLKNEVEEYITKQDV